MHLEPCCLPCLTGYPEECWQPDEYGNSKCVLEPKIEPEFTPLFSKPKPRTTQKLKVSRRKPKIMRVKKYVGRPVKDFKDITDLRSTGRKYAARMYPIKEGMICEWNGLANAGGGPYSITGCGGNLATVRHHGPDKNTLNNEFGNVHRICATCHNRWHAANDKFYPLERPPGDVAYLPNEGIEWTGHDRETKIDNGATLENTGSN